MEFAKIRQGVRFWRKKRNMTQRELGKRLGVDQPTVSKWESGARGMDSVVIEKIFSILSVDINFTCGAQNARPSKPKKRSRKPKKGSRATKPRRKASK